MSDLESRLAKLTPAQRALFEKRTRAKQSAGAPEPSDALAESSTSGPAEPIAIVGLACRLPGGATLADYWQTILSGADAITETPPDRWRVDPLFDPDGAPGKLSTRWGGFLEDIDQFDPRFFGVTPREANRMDPQQRLLLEVAWEALEHGGLPADELAGSNTGVFVGIGGNDYSKVPLHRSADYLASIDGYMGTGNALSIAANRLSYTFDFKGPSLAIDTACSSSSVAICLAVEALRRGECTAAIAAGVNAILTPETTIAFSNARMLSPHGRCRPFDAAADGYVRGEGCGVVVLKRLSDARRDGDHVTAVLRAAAMNQDGRTSGISAPNGESQKACLRAAHKQAGVTTADLSYIEAHGTGTPLGDPIEMRALTDLFRAGEADGRPLRVASVKANIGHTETVSGVAGLLKVALMLRHGVIPPHAGFEALNPHIDLAGSRVEIPTEAIAWRGPQVAGVSSFGFGGTNSHLIVSAPDEVTLPASDQAESTAPSPTVIKLSAKSPSALAEWSGALADWLKENPETGFPTLADATNHGRVDHNERAALVAADANDLTKQLRALAVGRPSPATRRSTVNPLKRCKTAMLFSGQGAQYAGMGRELYQSNQIFRREIDRSEEVLTNLLDEPLTKVLFGDASAALIDQTVYTQPALFAVEHALAAVWKSLGVEPDFVAGHSIGEYVAAAVAGVMDSDDALRLVAERGRLMQRAPLGGKMAAVFADETSVRDALAGDADRVAIAAVNGPANTVVSGEADAVDRVLARLASRGAEFRELAVSHAFHSPMMDELLDDFEAFAATIPCRKPDRPLASNLTGRLMTEAPTARYWRDHLRGAVRFADNVRALADAGANRFLEAGPGASLLGMAKRTLPADAFRGSPSLRKGVADQAALAAAVADHWADGGRIRWRGLTPRPAQRLWIPTYPFERTRCWIEGVDPGDAETVVQRPTTSAGAATLLGARAPMAWSSTVFESRFSADSPALLADHQVQGSVVTPAAVYLEQALQAADAVFGGSGHAVADLKIGQAMFLIDDAARRVQVTLAPESGGAVEAAILSQPADDPEAEWNEHATARLVRAASADGQPEELVELLSTLRGTQVPATPRDDFYRKIDRRGFHYGPAMRAVGEMVSDGGAALAELIETPGHQEFAKSLLHPVWGDACLQTIAGAVDTALAPEQATATYMPVAIGSLQIAGGVAVPDSAAEGLRCVARISTPDAADAPEVLEGDAWLIDAGDTPVVAMQGIRLQRVGAAATADPAEWRYQSAWRPAPLANADDGSAEGVWLLLTDGRVVDDLADRLKATGGQCVVVELGNALTMAVEGPSERTRFTVEAGNADHLARVLETITAAPGMTVRGVVFGWALATAEADLGEPSDWPVGADAALVGAMQVVQQLARRQLQPAAGVVFATRGAQAVGGADQILSVSQAPLLGFARVAHNEHPELTVRRVDLDPNADAAEDLTAEVLTTFDGESEVAYRGAERFAPRLEREASAERAAGPLAIPAGEAHQLRIPKPGALEALRYEPVRRLPPEPGQVEFQVHAAGLNFSDVLKALGLYPGIKDKIVPLGIEASGVVTAVGEGVERFAVGDEVFGVAPYAFGSHAMTGEYTLVAKPTGLSHADAATAPITFLTAHHALVRLAQLARGERVLIHAGAGGVGLAAIQIAQSVGAEVFATAGNDAKRDYLRRLGVQHVYDSRTLDFHDQILADTGGEGVDVVLNSLPGEAIPKSLALLRAYGRFLEIGKTDIYQDRRLGLLPFQDNLSYHAIDLDRVLRQRPHYIRGLMDDVVDRFAAGDYRPLERTGFAAEQTVDAFRYMSQRKNIGKVIVEFGAGGASSSGDERAKAIRSDGTYLITGGLGALGLRVAQRLADEGAGALALVSRRTPSDAAEHAIASLEGAGARVVHLQADATDFDSLAKAIEQLGGGDLPPLRGVVHAAGVLADGLIGAMTPEQLERAVRPKTAGAWNLHRATRDAALDFFVLFSSVASVLGSPGQANYAAGNAALDALSHARRRAGLPATALNWGPWAEAGMAAADARADGLESRGTRLLPADGALDTLIQIINDSPSGPAQVTVFDADWSAMRRVLGDRPAPLLEGLLPAADEAAAKSGVDTKLRRRLLACGPDERLAELQTLVRDDLARVMSVDPVSLDPAQPLAEYGIDSLMSLELKNGLERRLGVTLPMAKLLEGPSIESLAAVVDGLLASGKPAEAEREAWSPLSLMRAATGGSPVPPLFLLPTLGGDVLGYRELVAQLATDAPVYAFRPRGVDDPAPPHDNMGELAADYAAAIRQQQPTGPYRLAGWSTGGLPALAVAERLEAEGHEVALVSLFDTPPPSTYRGVEVDDEARLLHETMLFVSRFSGLSFGMTVDELRAVTPEERFAAAVAEARRAGLFSTDVDESHLRRMVGVGVALIRACADYQPGELRAPVVLFRPQTVGVLPQLATSSAQEDRGWGDEADLALSLHAVEGDHFSMMTGEGARQIAERLDAMLAAKS